MPQTITSIPRVANGNINTAVFVKEDTTRGFAVLQAGAGDQPVGVSQDGSLSPPGLIAALGGSGGTNLAAVAGRQLTVWGPGDNCNLTAGTGGWTAGALLMPDANGCGVVATTGNYAGARGLDTVAAGELGRVVVLEADKV